jgi:hypothetical protein
MTTDSQNKVISLARTFIGIPHSTLDCSNAVWAAYSNAGMKYSYKASWQIKPTSPPQNFKWIGKNLPPSQLQPADMIVFGSHMGIWDPDGCKTIGTNAECKNLKNNAPFLSSRGGDTDKNGKVNDRGQDYGRLEWWGSYNVYRWIK